MKTRKVKITVTNKLVGSYEARSYPHDDYNKNGRVELYKVPVYEITIAGKDNAGTSTSISYKAPRFMPYWNDPKNPSSHYKTLGWINSGLSAARTIKVGRFIRDYEIHNRHSTFKGAIVMEGAFYIHGGPVDVTDVGFGSAGCIEIIGNYDLFKADIASLSGSSQAPDDGIAQLVSDGNLIVIIQTASRPNIRSLLTREIIM